MSTDLLGTTASGNLWLVVSVLSLASTFFLLAYLFMMDKDDPLYSDAQSAFVRRIIGEAHARGDGAHVRPFRAVHFLFGILPAAYGMYRSRMRDEHALK